MADQNSPAVKTVSFADFRQGLESGVKKRHESLMELFPRVDPDFLFGKAVEFEGKDEEMNHWIVEIYDKDLEKTFPTREDREKRHQIVEENIKDLAKLDMLEIQKAGICGLEYCPWCPFAIIISADSTSKEFKCQNQDCLKSSCRSCKKPYHDSIPCNETQENTEKENSKIPKEDVKINVKKVFPTRSVDPSVPENREFREIEGYFLRMKQVSTNNKQQQSSRLLSASGYSDHIASIDFVKNPILEKKFEAKKMEFRKHNIPSDVVFAFHGTKPGNVESIFKENLSIIRRAAYGGGYYFSEFPGFSLAYGPSLLVFKTLPGLEYKGQEMNQHHGSNAKYQSKKVECHPPIEGMEEYGNMLIIANNQQFIPYCQINFTKLPVKRTAEEEARAAEAQKRRIVVPKGASFGSMIPSPVGTMGPTMTNSGLVSSMGPNWIGNWRLTASGFNIGLMDTSGPSTSARLGSESKHERFQQLRKDMEKRQMEETGNATAADTTTNQLDENKSLGPNLQIGTSGRVVGTMDTIAPSTNDQGVMPNTSSTNQQDGNRSDPYQTMADIMQTATSLFRNSGASSSNFGSESGSLALNSTSSTQTMQSINPAAIVIPPMFGNGREPPQTLSNAGAPSKNASNEADDGRSQSSSNPTSNLRDEPSTDPLVRLGWVRDP